LSRQQEASEETATVVAAARDLASGAVLSEDSITKRTIPASARPVTAISWANASMLLGQRAIRPVLGGDYILIGDVGFTKSVANVVGKGEWAVTVRPAQSMILGLIQPGDEVALTARLTVEEMVLAENLSGATEKVTKDVSLVLLPRVPVIEARTFDAAGLVGGGELLVSLPPDQALFLLRIQQDAEIQVALRRPGDSAALNRADAGYVDAAAVRSLAENLQRVTFPMTPGLQEAGSISR